MDKPQSPPLGQLRWRTRRGLRELDMVLQIYLEQRYPQAPKEERMAFVELLERNDADILDWLLERKTAPEHLTDVIRSLRPAC